MKRMIPLMLVFVVLGIQHVSAQHTWKPLPMQGTHVYELAAGHDGMIWAATANGLLYSTDNGRSWKRTFVASTAFGFSDIGATYDDHGTPHLMARSVLDGYYRSADNGVTWTATPDNDSFIAAAETGRLTTRDGSVLRSIYEAGLWRSTDGGTTFDMVLYTPGNTPTTMVQATTGTLFASGEDGGVFSSTDDGATWTEFFLHSDETTATRRMLARDGELVYVVYNGVYRSGDGGQTWERTDTDVQLEGGTTILLPNGDVLTSAYDEGLGLMVRVTADGDIQTSTEGIDHGPISTLLPAGDGDVLMGTRGALYRSEDNGATWQPSQEGIRDHLRLLAYNRTAPGSPVYIASFYSLYSYDGETLTSLMPGLPRKEISLYGMDVSNNGTLILATGTGGFYRSHDNGATFLHRPSAYIGAIHTLRSGMVLATYANIGLLASVDEGVDWTEIVSINSNPLFPSFDYLASTSTGYTITGSLLTDAVLGLDWEAGQARVLGSNVRDLEVASNDELYVITTEGRVFFSTDLGTTWKERTPAALTGGRVYALAAGLSGDMFCATSTGVWHTTDRGATWQQVGWQGSTVLEVAVDGQGRLYAGVRDSGVYVTEAFVVGVDDGAEPAAALQIQPNPATDEAVLSMTLAHGDFVTVTVYDALGRSVADVLNEYRGAGRHTVRIPVSALAAGTYRAVVRAGETVTTQNIVVVR